MAKVIKLESKKNAVLKDAAANIRPGKTETPAYYQQQLKEDPLNQKAYNRLMILYRKLKEYKKELHTINSAIRSFEAFNKSHKKKAGKTIQTISNKLNRSLGLVDHKGKAVYDAEPVAGWKKRKEVVVKKIKG